MSCSKEFPIQINEKANFLRDTKKVQFGSKVFNNAKIEIAKLSIALIGHLTKLRERSAKTMGIATILEVIGEVAKDRSQEYNPISHLETHDEAAVIVLILFTIKKIILILFNLLYKDYTFKYF